MSNDEQIEEIEVLQSIYPDEFTLLTSTSFRIKLILDIDHLPNHSDESPVPPTLSLTVSYPPTYPDVAPDYDFSLLDPGTVAPGLVFPDDKPDIQSQLETVVEENLGMAVVFTLSSTLKDAAETLLADRAGAVEAEREAALRKEEEKEMEKFRGELVTRERFLEWRERFMRERAEAEVKDREAAESEERGTRRNAVVQKEKKLTGKELWERGLVGDLDEDLEDGDAVVDIADKVEGLKV